MNLLSPRKSYGAALIIVLAFLVILSGIVVAYLSRTSVDRQLAHASFSNVSADELAKSALDLTVADLKQEIANGVPTTNANITPQRSPKPSFATVPAITNLIRRSVRSDAIPAPAIASRASAVNSTTDVSANGRSITLARWNSHYMFPRANTAGSSSDPITTGFSAPNYWSPDWVIVTRDGPVAFSSWDDSLADATPSNTNFAIGRYAFGIYDEGGQLDANVVGLPTPAPGVTDIGRKGVTALADLTGMKITAGGSTPNPVGISKLVGWRNYATLQSSGTFPNLSPTPIPTTFMSFVLDPVRDFRTVATTTYLGRTDQAFVTRKELIDFIGASSNSYNLLQFLGTFSRERNIPTYKAGTTSLTSRFALGNLGLVKDNPDPSKAADIQRLFGLRWVAGTPGSLGPPPVAAIPGHWQYVGKIGNTPLSVIPSFTTDPEFFQLLNYAVYATNSDDFIHIGTTLGLGATIIDQYDEDTSADPTTTTTSTMIEYGGGNWVVGMENNDPARPSPSPQPSPFPPPGGMSPTPRPYISTYTMLNRPFRNVGEIGYAMRPEKTPAPITVDFATATSRDAAILDLFTYNTAPVRAGIVNLNTANPAVIAALVKSTITTDATSTPAGSTPANNAAASPTPNPTSGVIGDPSLGTLNNPALGRSDIARLVAATGTVFSSEEEKETVARALADVTQTRTWGLFIDVIAQSGRYPPGVTALKDFVVTGEKRYWLHIAIDRFTGEVVDQQLEAVTE